MNVHRQCLSKTVGKGKSKRNRQGKRKATGNGGKEKGRGGKAFAVLECAVRIRPLSLSM